MEICKATPKDAAILSHIHAKSWKGGYRGIIPQDYLDTLEESYWESAFTQWLESQTLDALLLCVDGVAAACISYGKSRDETLPDWGEIVSLYVLPEFFRKGYGQMLLEQALSDLRKSGFQNAYLWVLEENERGRRFYEACEFRPTSDRISFEIQGKTIFDIRYQKKL